MKERCESPNGISFENDEHNNVNQTTTKCFAKPKKISREHGTMLTFA